MPQSGRLRPVLVELADMAEGFVLSQEARQAAIEAVLDTITAAAAAPRFRFAEAVQDTYGTGDSAVWFSGLTASCQGAAFANAMSAAYMDLDDGHRRSRGHPGAAVVPAVFAEIDRRLAAGIEIDDEAVLRAIAIGYEVGLRVAGAKSFYARTGFWAGIAAAAAVGSLQDLGPDEMANALAIAGETGPHMATTTSPPAWPQPNGTDVKEGIPWGVVTGISAVRLAQAGMTGAVDLVDHAPFFDAEAILADRAMPAICETYTKFHAACRHVHAPVEAFASLVSEHGLLVDDVESVTVRAYSGALRIPNSPRPNTLVDAQYSIPYCVALVALKGPDVLLSMSASDLGDATAEAFAALVKVETDPLCEARFPAETPVIVEVKTREEVFASPVTTPSGEANARPSWDERLRKFYVSTQRTLSVEERNEFIFAFEELRIGQLRGLCLFLQSNRALPSAR
ncbi:2-methylcitrate dehydratase PrpD [Litoreibacter meonggei]|uniref:2-methylcitrate dehydratase PrpD n=1 Tax=Litoreibacter meonggei TaxID=1049199 RepID=A0A497X2P6_9RHOB|nr:MmgE/PrpD family protein [Litoreibacter meonggei]RLJ60033.1 2-methylcitrate dehydratase PrpD [Litoreibacter meonggei]